MPAGPDWPRAVRTDVVDGIAGVELRVPGADKVAARWSEILARPVVDGAITGTRRICRVDFRF